MEKLPGRKVVVAIAVLAGVGLLVGYGVAMRARPKTATISLASPSPASKPGGGVLVHVGGEVARPGVYELGAGARVNDAVDAAGGATGKADLDGLNLAAKVKDGDKILVPGRTRSGAQGPAGAGPGGAPAAGASATVNLNTATLPELEMLPGIGPALAQRIIDFRTQRGGFRRIEDLMDVPGIGPKKFEDLKPHVSV